MTSENKNQKKPLKVETVLIAVIGFGLCIVGISYAFSKIMFPNTIMEGTDIIVTAILSSAITMITIAEIQRRGNS